MVWLLYRVTRITLENKPLAEFEPAGVITEQGDFLSWSQISKIYLWTGVLFIRDQSGNEIVRLDPAEVGGRTLKRVKSLIRANAPAGLSGDI
jgi:hypothetical protein